MRETIKQFLLIFIPSVLLIFGISLMIYFTDFNAERKIIKTRETHLVKLKKEVIIRHLHAVVSDLMFLAEQEELIDSIDQKKLGKYMVPNYLSFSQKRGLYDQIRILTDTGREVLRVDYNNGQPAVAFELLLQSKKNRYYFENTFALNRKEVYMSPFDLNVEDGEIEKPLKPTIRVGTPIFNGQNQKKGVFLLNFLSSKMIQNFREGSKKATAELMLVNSSGFWLSTSNPKDEWGFMLEDRKDKNFENIFPGAWIKISNSELGDFFNKNIGLFTYTTVFPLKESLKSSGFHQDNGASSIVANAYYWKIVSYVPQDILNTNSSKLLIRYVKVNTSLYMLLAIGSWFLAHARVNQKLEEEEKKRLSGAVEHAVEGVVITDLKGDIQYVNPAFQLITGYTKQEVMGKNPSIIKSGIHDENFYKEMWACILSGNTWKSEYVNKRKNGSLYNAYASISPIKNRKGKIINFVGVSIDITESKRSQEAIANKVEELSRSHKMLEQFASDVSLKIDSFTQLLEKQFKNKLDTDTSGFFKFTVNGISGIQELIRDLLIFSRLSSFSESLKPTDVKKVFKNVLSDIEKIIKDNRAAVTCDSLPTVMADEDRLAELFKNLISNAIKYCDKDTPRVHVSVNEREKPSAVSDRETSISTQQTDKEWVFSVADNGMGIDKQHYKQIFKRFKRLHAEKNYPGTGVGLAICKEIVEQFGGNIWVESKVGKETIFYFTIPVMQ